MEKGKVGDTKRERWEWGGGPLLFLRENNDLRAVFSPQKKQHLAGKRPANNYWL